jgi:hypothetical protein
VIRAAENDRALPFGARLDLRDPGSPLYIAELNVVLAVAGVLSGTVLTAPGRRSGGT